MQEVVVRPTVVVTPKEVDAHMSETPAATATATATVDVDVDVDVVVIGSGIGGLAAAALLVKDGASVVVSERRGKVGGRMGTVERQGFLNMAQDGMLKALDGTTSMEEVMRVVDLPRG